MSPFSVLRVAFRDTLEFDVLFRRPSLPPLVPAIRAHQDHLNGPRGSGTGEETVKMVSWVAVGGCHVSSGRHY